MQVCSRFHLEKTQGAALCPIIFNVSKPAGLSLPDNNVMMLFYRTKQINRHMLDVNILFTAEEGLTKNKVFNFQ